MSTSHHIPADSNDKHRIPPRPSRAERGARAAISVPDDLAERVRVLQRTAGNAAVNQLLRQYALQRVTRLPDGNSEAAAEDAEEDKEAGDISSSALASTALADPWVAAGADPAPAAQLQRHAGHVDDVEETTGPHAPDMAEDEAVGATEIALQRSTDALLIGSPQLLQRHPEGTALVDKDTSVAEIDSKKSASAEIASTPSPTPAEDTAQQPTATEDTAQQPPSATMKSGGGLFARIKALGRGLVAGITSVARRLIPGLSPKAMSLATAQTILQGAYGGVHTIVPGTIVILADQPACAAKYDEVCINAGIINPNTGVLWAAGDCQTYTPGVEGFAWQGTVYVNGQTPLITATAHEMLHNNTAAGFRAAVGETFNEGATELLAIKALNQAAVVTPASATAYPDQVGLTRKLIAYVGEDTLIDAYFGGAATLITAYENKKGVGTWATLKGYAEALDIANAEAAMT